MVHKNIYTHSRLMHANLYVTSTAGHFQSVELIVTVVINEVD